MAAIHLRDVLRRLRGMAPNQLLHGAADRQLLKRFVGNRDDAAFEALVARHGPMVLGVCRRILAEAHGAEDAFQATFLVLARRAATIRDAEHLGNWLYGVACRAALKARDARSRRNDREQRAAPREGVDPLAEISVRELCRLLDHELCALPNDQRAPLVLCYLQGKTRDEAALELGWSLATLGRRLARGREVLRMRLGRRGVALSVALLSTALAQGALFVSAELLRAAASAGSPHVVALADSVTKSMLLATVKSAAVGLGTVGFVAAAFTWLVMGGTTPAPGNAPFRPPINNNHQDDVAQVQPAAKLMTLEARKAFGGGLDYLAQHQGEDGAWGTNQLKGNVGVTALAGLAFLSAKNEAHAAIVAKAVDYVLSQESKEIPGYFGGTGLGNMYAHGYGVWFLAEAHGKLTDKARQAKVKDALRRGVQVILDAQNRVGGWRYQPRPLDADVTVTACQLHALRAARDAGIGVPKKALDDGARYLLSCQEGESGGFRYVQNVGAAGFARTAAALSALEQIDPDNKAERAKAIDYLRTFVPGKKFLEPGSQVHFYFGQFYAARVLKNAGGEDWQAWYSAIRDHLLKQGGDHRADGSWNDSTCPHYGTALAVMILGSGR